MYVGLAIKGYIVINDVRNAFDVEPTRGNIGCHDDINPTVLQLLYRFKPRFLIDISV